MQPFATKEWHYLLRDEDLALYVRKKKNGEAMVYVQFLASFLWRRGYRRAYQEVEAWVAAWADKILKARISRMDLACDFQGWAPKLTDFTSFVTRATKSSLFMDGDHRDSDFPDFEQPKPAEAYRVGSRFTGFRFGSGKPMLCRIYDKTMEIKAGQDRKAWFYDVWQVDQEEAQEDHVWRVEYQVRRGAIRDFRMLDPTTGEVLDGDSNPALIFQGLQAVWRYLAADWCSLRVRSRTDTERFRWELRREWRKIAAASWAECRPFEFSRHREPRKLDVQAMVPGLLGYLSTVGAKLATMKPRGHPERPVFADELAVLHAIMPEIKEYRGKVQRTFLEDVDFKTAAIEAFEVGDLESPPEIAEPRKTG